MSTYPNVDTTAYGGAGAAGSAQAAANTFIPIAWHREMLVSREPRLQLVLLAPHLPHPGRVVSSLSSSEPF